ncbi:M23 family metallopeptidase [Jiella sp. MQZ9-1]|uniref:M23 family metallopeptidase n=1 Tax=Jiella flava TaxID=2816857 RepID=A0A939JWS5_9HYPH|nr:M23 family metallopeptidase [Jiella flava]MBO0663337.1 M23 family metallopeptidase [Jiella flava]MCD2471913.1 M23 family metallopeptidase [Jiella flava]
MNRTAQDSPGFCPSLGDEPALIADRRRRPDKRQVSARWLTGTLLTGLTSTALMGIALSAALDGHHGAASPAVAMTVDGLSDDQLAKGQRVVATAMPVARSRQIMELSTLTRDGDREVLRTLPFGYVNMLLAARYQAPADYPRFDPLKIFGADDEKDGADEPAKIYGNRVESEVSLKVSQFDFEPSTYERNVDLDAASAENLVRSVASRVGNKPVQVASLSSVDPFRFGLNVDMSEYEPGSAFRVVPENVSFAVADTTHDDLPRFHEEIVPFRQQAAIADILSRAGHDGEQTKDAVDALTKLIGADTLEPGDALRIGVETTTTGKGDTAASHGEVVRLSAYRGGEHLGTVAATKDGPFEPADAPEMSDSVAEGIDENEDEAPIRADMPTVYDGIYQAALSYGLDQRMCRQLVRMLASDIDLQARLSPSDRLVVFYSMTGEKGKDLSSAEASEMLYVEIHVGDLVKRYYRFRPNDSKIADYFDPSGRSARQFLLRKPVPNGRFTSGFSTGRRHPVLGYIRPHWGVDWAAPRGTPILAAGDGVVEKAGWATGYGRETVLRHANGYETVYAHQSGFANNIKPGTHVRQGQVIGYVGSTGISTGNHLHFEIHVNDKRMDPMRIKLPAEKILTGDDLLTFKRERDRIDTLLKDRVDEPLLAAK